MRTVPLPETATIAQIAERAEVESTDIIVELLSRNVLATINAAIDRDTARAVLAKLGVDVIDEESAAPAATAEVEKSTPADAEAPTGDPRPPVVTVMGHVDHGKTTLLDAIRQTQVAAGEHGGITQSIGAYQVTTGEGAITFIDTPGHEAFTAMRARGAGVTDIVVVVVAADDGVMPQTVEAIGHARAAGVPMIMAVNKIDLPTANPERAYQQLTEHEVVVEAYGGDVVAVPLSAEQGDGIDELLEYINLTAQLEELRAPVDGPAVATVIETRLDRSQGPIASAIITSGTLTVGDQVRVGNVEGRIRALFDHNGERLKQAGPSTPVQVVGLESTPTAGDELRVAKRSKRRRRAERSAAQHGGGEQAIRLSLEQLAAQMTAGQLHQLSVVVKASTDGAAAAVVKSLGDVGEARTRAVVIYEGVGTITESDVNLAAAAEGIVVGFRRADRPGRARRGGSPGRGRAGLFHDLRADRRGRRRAARTLGARGVRGGRRAARNPGRVPQRTHTADCGRHGADWPHLPRRRRAHPPPRRSDRRGPDQHAAAVCRRGGGSARRVRLRIGRSDDNEHRAGRHHRGLPHRDPSALIVGAARMPTRRPERIAAQIAREASEIVRFTLGDPNIRLVTVNRAQVSPDLRRATIFVTVLGDAEQCEESIAALERAEGVVRRELSARLRLRFTPQIRFQLDPGMVTEERMRQLLDEEREDSSPGASLPAERSE